MSTSRSTHASRRREIAALLASPSAFLVRVDPSAAEPDTHVSYGLPVRDPVQAAASCEVDAAADRRWFRRHKGVRVRTRPASVRERRAFGLADGTTVRVYLLSGGSQTRAFCPPKEGRRM